MKEWIAQSDPTKEASTVKKLSGRSLLLSPNKMTHYLKELTTASGVLKNILPLQIFDASNISPLKSSYSQKLQYRERKLRL